jgi:hypothetical protein
VVGAGVLAADELLLTLDELAGVELEEETLVATLVEEEVDTKLELEILDELERELLLTELEDPITPFKVKFVGLTKYPTIG